MPAPGRRCPDCLEGGQTVWVVFGKCCPNCGTPTAPKPPDEPKSTYNGKSRDDLVEVEDAAEKRRTQNKIAQRRFRGMRKGRIYQCLYPPCTYTSRQESNLKQHIEKSHSQINFRSKDNSENDDHVSQRAYAIDATHLEEEVGGEDTVRSAGPVTATTLYSSTGFPSTNDTPTNFQSASTTMEDLEPESTITSASWTDDLPEPVAIKCVCDFRDDTRHIVQCEQCETWQHISCYYENAKRIVSIHKCVKCSPRDLAKQYEEPSGFGEQETSSATNSLFTSGKYKSPTATESKTTSVSTADYTTGASDIESGSVADRKAAGLLPVTPERDRELRTALLHTGDNLTIGSDRTELDKLEAVLSTSLTEAPESTIDVDTSTEETGMEKNHSDEPDTAEYPANTPSNSEKPSDLALKATEKSRQIDKATVSTVSSNYGGSGPHDLRVHSVQNRILEGRVGMSTMNYAISDDQRFFFGPGFQYEDDLPSAGSISDASTTYQSSGLGSDSTNYTVYSIGGSSSPTFSIRPVMRRHESDFSPIRLTRESTPPSVATPARSTQDLRDAFKRAHTTFRNHSPLSSTSDSSTNQARPRPMLRRNEPLSKQTYEVMRQRAPRGSDKSNPHAYQPITTRTNSGDTSEIRLRVDTSSPLILAIKGEVEGRTLQVNPIEDGRAEIVIGSQPNRQTPTRDSRSNAEIYREPKHEKEHHFPSLRYELGRHTLDTRPSITAKFNESLVFNLLRNIESLDDLYACAMVNRVFYHVFKQHEPGLLEAVKKEPTRRGATSTSADLELHDAEDRGDLLSNDFPASTDVMNPLFKKVRVAKAETSGQRDRRRRVPLEELDQTYTPLGQGMSQWKWNLGFEAEVITQSGDNPFIEEFHEFRKLRAEHLRLKEQSSAEGPTSTRSGARISQLRRLEKFCEARNMKGPVLQSFEALFSQEFNGEEEITQQSHAELQPRPSEEEQERKTGKKLIPARAHILSLAEITRQAPEGILYTLSRYGGYGDLTKNQRPQPPVAPGPDFIFVVTKHPDDFRTNSKIAMPKKRTKTGCLTCRKRRIKCGAERPTCMNCIKSKRQCEGYNQRVVFSTHVGMWLGRTGLRTKAKLQYPISTSYSSDQLLLQDHQGNLAPTRFIPLSYIWPLQDLWMSLPLWLRESFRSSDNDWAQDWSIQLLLQDNESTLAPIQLRGWNWRERPAVRVLLLEYENTLTPIHSLGRTYSDLVHEQWLEVRSLYSSDNGWSSVDNSHHYPSTISHGPHTIFNPASALSLHIRTSSSSDSSRQYPYNFSHSPHTISQPTSTQSLHIRISSGSSQQSMNPRWWGTSSLGIDSTSTGTSVESRDDSTAEKRLIRRRKGTILGHATIYSYLDHAHSLSYLIPTPKALEWLEMDFWPIRDEIAFRDLQARFDFGFSVSENNTGEIENVLHEDLQASVLLAPSGPQDGTGEKAPGSDSTKEQTSLISLSEDHDIDEKVEEEERFEPHYFADQTLSDDTNWKDIRDQLPEDWMWDLTYDTPHVTDANDPGCWTCTPNEPDDPKNFPLTISGAPVVIPIEHQWPPMAGVNPPPDPRPSTLIDCTAELSLDMIRDIFLTFEGSIGFYLLINGLLQILVPEDFDREWASSHLPHKFGGLKISYINQTMQPTATLLPSKTATLQSQGSQAPPSSNLTNMFRSSRTANASSTQPLSINDFIEARPKSLHRKERFAGRIGLKVTKGGDPYLIMSTHVITEAILARSQLSGFLGRRDPFEKLDDDWNSHVEIWAGNEKIGTIHQTFDPDAELYPTGFHHDITLIKPLHPPTTHAITSPLPNLGWLSRASWHSLRHRSSSPIHLLLPPTSPSQSAKTLKCSTPSQVLVVGEGIFLNQRAGAAKPAREHDIATWKDLVSRAVLYRVCPDFEPPTGYSGVAVYAEGTREDGTQGVGVVGFQSFVQRSGHVQSFEMEGGALEKRLRLGRVAFYGAFQVPEEVRVGYEVV